MSAASGADLTDFVVWYGRAGTPRVHATLRHEDERAMLALLPPPGDRPLPIPLRLALFGAESGTKLAERLVVLRGAEEVTFEGISERPLLSLNRGFSAPVLVETERSLAHLAALARDDDDPFARHEAMQLLMGETIREAADPTLAVAAVGEVLAETTLEPGLVAELVSLPREAEIADKRTGIDPAQLHDGWLRLRAGLGRAHEAQWRRLQAMTADSADRSAHAKGTRRLRSIALDYLLAGGASGAGALGLAQYESAPTMTERQGALRALADSDAPERAAALAEFHRRYRSDPLLLDAWFSIQASSARADTIETAPRLLAHPDFTLAHPRRLGAIVGTFAANFHAFHDASGRGYRFLADVALVLDRMNPAGAARLVRAMGGWRQLEPARRDLLLAQLERMAAAGASTNLTAAVGALLR
jgi:aminopeptidase N